MRIKVVKARHFGLIARTQAVVRAVSLYTSGAHAHEGAAFSGVRMRNVWTTLGLSRSARGRNVGLPSSGNAGVLSIAFRLHRQPRDARAGARWDDVLSLQQSEMRSRRAGSRTMSLLKTSLMDASTPGGSTMSRQHWRYVSSECSGCSLAQCSAE